MADDWQGFRRSLTAFIRRWVSSPEDAEDIVQEVLLRLHTHRDDIATERIGPWLFRVSRNVVIDHYRTRASQPRQVELLDELLPGEEVSTAAEKEIASCLLPLLQQLPRTYAEAIRLADLEGNSQKRVAKILGLGLSGAKSRIQRGRALLRSELERCCRVEWDCRGNVVDVEKVGPGPACSVPSKKMV